MLLRFLRRLVVWIGPLIVLLIMVLAGFAYWVLDTQAGTRWALLTAAEQLDGRAEGISGTIWDGVQIHQLSLDLPTAAVDLQDVYLRASWRELVDTRLHIAELSAASARIDLLSGPEDETPSEPFQMPALPIQVVVDRLALGELHLAQDGVAMPMTLREFASALRLDEAGAQVVLQSAQLEHQDLYVTLEGELKLLELADPWPLRGHLLTHAAGRTEASPLCAHQYLATLPAGETPTACTVDIDTQLDGNLDELHVVLSGNGQGMSVDADLNLTPRAGFPLKDAMASLRLADGSSLDGKVDWSSGMQDDVVQDHVVGSLRMDKLDVGQLAGDAIPPAVLTLATEFDLRLRNHSMVESADITMAVAEGSTWNEQALAGHFNTQVVNATPQEWWRGLQLAAIDMDLTLGKNHLQAQGSLGAADSGIDLDLSAPALAAFWPDLAGSAQLRGQISGTLAKHQADLHAQYAPGDSQSKEVGSAPVNAHVVLDGGWSHGSATPSATAPATSASAGGVAGATGTARTATQQVAPEGWRGTIQALDIEHADLGLKTAAPVQISFLPGVQPPLWQWQVGATTLQVLLSSQTLFTLDHRASRGGAGRWETEGGIARLPVSPRLVTQLREKFDPAFEQEEERGGVKLASDQGKDAFAIVLALAWDLKFAGTLTGTASIDHVSGDVMVPAQPDFPLGLQTLGLDITAAAAGASTSKITAELKVDTQRMGQLSATASTLLHATPGGGLYLEPSDVKTVDLTANIRDLGWTSLFLDDSMELGGVLQADVHLQSRPDGTWNSSGNIQGDDIRLIRIDDGIRLLDGTLSARLDGERLILDALRFPARLRVEPQEWRTAEWVSTNPDAKDGSLTLTGDWNLFESTGVVDVVLHRYPILQRADRYAMVSGSLRLAAELPNIAIKGEIVADAGWIDLDMLSSVPAIDSDVVVIRPGEEQQEVKAPMNVSMDLTLDLGPRFYLTGYGVNSGLVGQLHIMMVEGKLTAMGALHTRGGAIEAYGQRLQLRRGTLTFQGDIANPILDIEALRTGLAVEAGVKVAGTAKRPRIDLVSYPAVSEIEKLSWLLLGHGPNDSGGDIGLLISVGTSFLGSGEPFYRKFGIDEISMRSGDVGAAGSILPVESVVSGLDSGASDIERRFVMASKSLSRGFTVSIQQALADTGTVGRISYRLARGLTAELTAGTVNGLALVYRWFSRE